MGQIYEEYCFQKSGQPSMTLGGTVMSIIWTVKGHRRRWVADPISCGPTRIPEGPRNTVGIGSDLRSCILLI